MGVRFRDVGSSSADNVSSKYTGESPSGCERGESISKSAMGLLGFFDSEADPTDAIMDTDRINQKNIYVN
jgi:hypothetical protein